MESFKNMMPSQCTVVRNGGDERLDASELVPGDVVKIKYVRLLCVVAFHNNARFHPSKIGALQADRPHRSPSPRRQHPAYYSSAFTRGLLACPSAPPPSPPFVACAANEESTFTRVNELLQRLAGRCLGTATRSQLMSASFGHPMTWPSTTRR